MASVVTLHYSVAEKPFVRIKRVMVINQPCHAAHHTACTKVREIHQHEGKVEIHSCQALEMDPGQIVLSDWYTYSY